MTFNIRYENDTDGANRWSLRRELATDVIRRFDGDFVGLQEAMPGQIADLSKMLPEYPITADVTFLQD
jgi:endonuclease/exonuclease/phosphatase family metal-dependent hydrolase